MKKLISTLLAIITLFSFITLPVYASESSTVAPYLNNGDRYSFVFAISSTGLSEVNVTYSGISGVTQKVTVTTYLQKKTFGLFWTKVDIGTTNDEWVDTSTKITGTFTHQFKLSSTGTYRAVTKIVFSGNGGADDVIEDKIEKKYS